MAERPNGRVQPPQARRGCLSKSHDLAREAVGWNELFGAALARGSLSVASLRVIAFPLCAMYERHIACNRTRVD